MHHIAEGFINNFMCCHLTGGTPSTRNKMMQAWCTQPFKLIDTVLQDADEQNMRCRTDRTRMGVN